MILFTMDYVQTLVSTLTNIVLRLFKTVEMNAFCMSLVNITTFNLRMDNATLVLGIAHLKYLQLLNTTSCTSGRRIFGNQISSFIKTLRVLSIKIHLT